MTSYVMANTRGRKETWTFFAFVRVFFRPCEIFNLVMLNDYVDEKFLTTCNGYKISANSSHLEFHTSLDVSVHPGILQWRCVLQLKIGNERRRPYRGILVGKQRNCKKQKMVREKLRQQYDRAFPLT